MAPQTKASRRASQGVALALSGALALAYAPVAAKFGLAPESPLVAAWYAGARIDVLVEGGQWWRLVAASFAHATGFHAVANILGVYWLIPVAARLHGAAASAVCFGAAAIVGTFASYALQPEWSIGASGGVFGLIGFAVSGLVRRGQTSKAGVRRDWLGVLPWILVAGLFVLQWSGDGIDHIAHAAGLAVGITATSLLRRLGTRRARRAIRFTAIPLVALVAVGGYGAVDHALVIRLVPTPTRVVRDGGLSYRVPAHWVSTVSREDSRCEREHTNGLITICAVRASAVEADPTTIVAELGRLGYREDPDAAAGAIRVRGWLPPDAFVPRRGNSADQELLVWRRTRRDGAIVLYAHRLAPAATVVQLERILQIFAVDSAGKS